jgi:hypothetical protein
LALFIRHWCPLTSMAPRVHWSYYERRLQPETRKTKRTGIRGGKHPVQLVLQPAGRMLFCTRSAPG